MFYDKYLELCKKAGEKPTPVAVSLGLSSSNVAQWKKGSIPRAHVLQKIAEHFNVPVSSLLDYLDEKSPSSDVEDGQEAELLSLIRKLTPDQRQRQIEVLQDIVGRLDK